MCETLRILCWTLALLPLASSCSPEGTDGGAQPPEAAPTNRLAIPPEVVANLGITFAKAERGRLDSWLAVPGELYVPGTHRWNLRAPAHGVVERVAPRWKMVETGELVAEVVSDELGEAQLHLLEAFSQSSRAKEESEAARSRFAESEAHLENTLQYASVSRERFDQVQRLTQDVRTIGSRELVEAQRSSLEAAKTALEAAVRRDELRAASRQKDLRLTQVQVRLDQRLSAFSVLTGHSVDELLKSTDGMQLWRTFTSLKVRAPARGTVVEVPVSRGEDVTDGAPLLVLLDVTRLRFRGWVPESDLLSLRTGALVQVELPGEMERITTELLRPLPLADAVTRRIRIEADVANPDGILPEGLSATAYVRVAKSLNEEVVVAEACVVRHGLELIVFRRDPKDPGFVVRTPVELGLRAAGKVEVLAGLLAGDSVVQKGIYQLKQAGVGRAQQEGHFHADGSFHDGEH